MHANRMKRLRSYLVLVASWWSMLAQPVTAQPVTAQSYSEKERLFRWGADEIEFCFEPSFRDGFVILLFPPREGKAQICAYKLHRKVADYIEFHSFTPAEQIAKLEISAREFDEIVSALESAALRRESERSRVGPDGSTWIFRRQVGGRSMTLRFWTPRASSEAGRLGLRLARAAKIDSNALDEK